MNTLTDFFQHKIVLTNWQIGLVKLSVASIYLGIGSYFADTFRPYAAILVVLGLTVGFSLYPVWFKAMRQ